MEHAKAFWERVLRVQPIADGDHHATYDFLYGMKIHGKPVAVARLPSLYLYIDWPKRLRPLAPVLNHLILVWQILRGVFRREYVIVREFRNGPFLLVAPLLWLLRNRFVLIINGNVPTAVSGKVTSIAFGLLVRMRFRFVLFDGEAAIDYFRARYSRIKLATPLFCIRDLCPPGQALPHANARFIVGLVGNFREEKGGLAAARDVIGVLNQIPGVDVAVGHRDQSPPAKLAGDAIVFRHTGHYSDYLEFLRSCDVILLIAERSSYEIRHSGVILDCLGQRVPVICPDYSLFSSVVSRPVRVGVTYQDFSDLPRAAQAALGTSQQLRKNFGAYFVGRDTTQVRACLEAFS